MHLCYVDESGTPDLPGNTSHFVLAGVSIPIRRWKDCDGQVTAVKARYRLAGSEIHAAWLARAYPEQREIKDFASLTDAERRSRVSQFRQEELLRLQRSGNARQYRQTKKNYRHTDAYVHLAHGERLEFLRAVADTIAGWSHARLFAECVDKVHHVGGRQALSVDEQAFEQLVSRFELFLENTRNRNSGEQNHGLLIHDNNATTAHKHTLLMQRFHRRGTFWTKVANIIETPLFVDSSLTSMVQIADLCCFALRRYVENREVDLFERVFRIADKNARGVVVGVRHYTNMQCDCRICAAHRQ
jgi:hypothetical protein